MTPVASANISCLGTVSYLGVDQSGQVLVANGTLIHVICSTATQGGYQINTQACKMFYATLLSSRLAGRSVRVYYNDPALTSCSQISDWSGQPSAYFIEQTN
jgi:hypothetical protein